MKNLRWCSLITSQGTNEPSLSKIAALTVYIFATIFFIYHNIRVGFIPELWWIFMTLPLAHNVMAKIITLKLGGSITDKELEK